MFEQDESKNIDSILIQIWIDLGHGALKGRHPYHTPVLATQGENGPDVRTVVLREADFTRRRLISHTPISGPLKFVICDGIRAWPGFFMTGAATRS